MSDSPARSAVRQHRDRLLFWGMNLESPPRGAHMRGAREKRHQSPAPGTVQPMCNDYLFTYPSFAFRRLERASRGLTPRSLEVPWTAGQELRMVSPELASRNWLLRGV